MREYRFQGGQSLIGVFSSVLRALMVSLFSNATTTINASKDI